MADVFGDADAVVVSPATSSAGGYVYYGDVSVSVTPTTTSVGGYVYYGDATQTALAPAANMDAYVNRQGITSVLLIPTALATWTYTEAPQMYATAYVDGTAGLSSLPVYAIPSAPAPSTEPPSYAEIDTAAYGGYVVRPTYGTNVVMDALTITDGFPEDWTYTDSITPDSFGVWRVLAWRTKLETPTDITHLDNAPLQIVSLEFADPFDDATAAFSLPQYVGYSMPPWLTEFTNIDVYWVPATSVSSAYPCINPITNQWDMYLHPEDQYPIWQGFIQSIDIGMDGVNIQCQGALYQLDRYYAKPLYPMRPKLVENMIERAFDPSRRGLWTNPLVINWETGWKTYSDTDYQKFITDNYGSARYVPTGTTIRPDGTISDKSNEQYSAQFGREWTGFTTRNTGSWEKLLTGYVNGQLSILYTENTDGDGLQKGDQWTILMDDRTPYMFVRRQQKDPDFYVCYGQPGVEVRLTRDGSVFNNVVFGTGRAYGDEEWSNFVQPTGTWTAWQPTAYDPLVWHGPDEWGWEKYAAFYDGYDATYERDNDYPVVERYAQFPDGISEGDGQAIGENWIYRDAEPGWMGDITLKVDPIDWWTETPYNKWLIKPGDVIFLKYFYDDSGTLWPGINKFHISQVTMSPMEGTVSLKVDTKFRDLLTAEEAQAKGRDSLSPIKALQIGKKSVLINDILMPWSNRGGSGCFPKGARNLKRTTGFPYEEDTTKNGQRPEDIFKPAYKTGNGALIQDIQGNYYDTLSAALDTGVTLDECFYVPIKATSNVMSERWCIFPMLLAQAVDISQVEFALYNVDGTVAECEFHVSIWGPKVNVADMPRVPPGYTGDDITVKDWGEYGGLWGGGETTAPNGAVSRANAWDPVRDDGSTWRDNDDGGWYVGSTSVQNAMIIGWGNYLNPCGYYPRKKGDDNAQMTGIFKDSANWSYDFNQWIDFHANKETKNSTLGEIDYSCWVAVHVNQVVLPGDQKWLYVMGRAYRKVAV